MVFLSFPKLKSQQQHFFFFFLKKLEPEQRTLTVKRDTDYQRTFHHWLKKGYLSRI